MRMYIVGGGCKAAFTKMGFQVVTDPFDADIFQFMGGEDVTPELYGEKNTHSYNSLDRDLVEMGYFQLAKHLGKPCVGICRGGQFLNVMCGGKMIQDVGGHTKNHEMVIDYGKVRRILEVTSTHHQMMVAGANGSIIGEGLDDGGVEVVIYRDLDCLCFQPHPEYYVEEMPELSKLYVDLIKYYFG